MAVQFKRDISPVPLALMTVTAPSVPPSSSPPQPGPSSSSEVPAPRSTAQLREQLFASCFPEPRVDESEELILITKGMLRRFTAHLRCKECGAVTEPKVRQVNFDTFLNAHCSTCDGDVVKTWPMTARAEEKPYECSECQKTFSTRSSLVLHIKLHEREKFNTSNDPDEGSCHKADQTCHSSSHGKYPCDKMMSNQQSSEDHFTSRSATENNFGDPEIVKREDDAESFIYITRSCPELANNVPEPFVKTEMDDIDIVKEEI